MALSLCISIRPQTRTGSSSSVQSMRQTRTPCLMCASPRGTRCRSLSRKWSSTETRSDRTLTRLNLKITTYRSLIACWNSWKSTPQHKSTQARQRIVMKASRQPAHSTTLTLKSMVRARKYTQTRLKPSEADSPGTSIQPSTIESRSRPERLTSCP